MGRSSGGGNNLKNKSHNISVWCLPEQEFWKGQGKTQIPLWTNGPGREPNEARIKTVRYLRALQEETLPLCAAFIQAQ